MLHPIIRFMALIFLVSLNTTASASLITTNRDVFMDGISRYFIDTYENPGYRNGDRINTNSLDAFSDQSMSAVINQTQYTTTGFTNLNLLVGASNHKYCAGCNGSFLLDFRRINLGGYTDINTVGFDFERSSAYYASVQFVDNTTSDFRIGVNDGFWGIRSAVAINSIHLGLAHSQITTNGFLLIDNLTIGIVELNEPNHGILWGLGILALLIARQRSAKSA